MPEITADIYVNSELVQKDVVIKYEDGNEPIDDDTPFHSGYLQIPFMKLHTGHKPVAKFNNGREYWLSLESGTIDLDSNETYFVLDNSYEEFGKPKK